MIRNYLKIAWRNLTKNKAFSFLNISGLAIGMASAVLILLWVSPTGQLRPLPQEQGYSFI